MSVGSNSEEYVINISDWWPEDEHGKPRSVNSVWRELELAGYKIGAPTLTKALKGSLSKVKVGNLKTLVDICSFLSGTDVSADDLINRS